MAAVFKQKALWFGLVFLAISVPGWLELARAVYLGQSALHVASVLFATLPAALSCVAFCVIAVRRSRPAGH